LYNEQSPDMLVLGARDADVWVDPGKPSQITLPVTLEAART